MDVLQTFVMEPFPEEFRNSVTLSIIEWWEQKTSMPSKRHWTCTSPEDLRKLDPYGHNPQQSQLSEWTVPGKGLLVRFCKCIFYRNRPRVCENINFGGYFKSSYSWRNNSQTSFGILLARFC